MTQVTERAVVPSRGPAPGRMWTVLGIVVIAVIALGWWFSGWSDGETTTVSNQFTVAEAIDSIVVRSDAGNITVTGADVTETSYVQVVHAGTSEPEVTRTVSGGTLRLEADCPFLSARCSVDFEITAPRGVEVDVSTSAGNVIVEWLDGEVTAETSAGNVILQGLAGPVDAHTSAGNVEGTSLETARIEASTSAGNVDLRFDREIEYIDATTSAGNVTIGVPGGPYDVDAESSIGKVTIEVPTDPSADARIVAQTSAGTVSVRSR
jgi:DUF4097 and DUF4098 domain-containing protein YvlB